MCTLLRISRTDGNRCIRIILLTGGYIAVLERDTIRGYKRNIITKLCSAVDIGVYTCRKGLFQIKRTKLSIGVDDIDSRVLVRSTCCGNVCKAADLACCFKVIAADFRT